MLEKISNLSFKKEDGGSDILEILIKEAFELNASDIHIDPTSTYLNIRFRIDGGLYRLPSVDLEKHSEIISRIKILAGLRIDERRKAQDGRMRLEFPDGKFVDIRISMVPSFHGESAVLRMLYDRDEAMNLSFLGFGDENLLKIERAIKKTGGMILSTGPTGSGKTTTLYSILKVLNREDVSIVTIEEPVEYSIPNIRQIQVDYGCQLNFANGLRSILRQDPNIIMVGEIRDKETAQIAVNAALTGHLLLSTLHTNDSVATLPRLIDMGVEPFLLASTFNLAINQRLVKKICQNCKAEIEIKDKQKRSLEELLGQALPDSPFYKGLGCEMCHKSGYSGRTLVAEVLSVDEEIRRLVIDKKSAGEIRRIAIKNGMTPLLHDGILKASLGITTLEEALRVGYE